MKNKLTVVMTLDKYFSPTMDHEENSGRWICLAIIVTDEPTLNQNICLMEKSVQDEWISCGKQLNVTDHRFTQ